jgi:hypothetical protein
MKHGDFARWTLSLTMLAGGLAATGSYARDLVLTRTAKSGADSIIAYERAWDGECQPKGSSVTFTSQARHGTVSVVQGISVIPPSTPRSGSTGRCSGRSIVGNEIHYLSSLGFHGTDHVSWTVVYSNRSEGGATDISIVVK